MKIKLIAFLILISIAFQIQAASIDTILIRSSVMLRQIKCVVILPASYNNDKRCFPVVYLLHGYGGKYSDWITKVPQLKTYSDKYEFLIVCPDGGSASWYFDSPVNPNILYETYIGKEVPEYIDSAYNTIKDRDHRAITGLSMGGHGALFLAWRHADQYGAAGSISGGLDLKESIHKFEIEKVLGDTTHFMINWEKYCMLNIAKDKPGSALKLIIDCGLMDIFIEGNRKIHQILSRSAIPHDYIERAGNHNWEYWSNAIEYQLLFFSKYFNQHG